MMIVRIFILVALIRLLLATNKPFLCAGIYAGMNVFFVLLGLLATQSNSTLNAGNVLGNAVIVGAISFLLAGAYFWLLDRFEESGVFWVILILGIVIGMV